MEGWKDHTDDNNCDKQVYDSQKVQNKLDKVFQKRDRYLLIVGKLALNLTGTVM